MPTLNVCVQIYMNKKNTKFIKITNIFIHIYIIYIYIYIHMYR